MKNNILDYSQPQEANIYTQKAFKYFGYSGLLFSIALLGIIGQITLVLGSEIMIFIVGLPLLSISITSTIGLKNALTSFLKKEPPQSKKYIGLIGNFIFFFFFLFLIFANLVDVFHFAN
ncbi:hypothetical protein [Aureispira anguillae]|uniref:Uncharacterized protein n=1 Tax=Aureispira anguillae TaxID=2864201 RepID=A0A915YDS6_9BACT|nr:hypothetical protein [Aureispira anguillae]BDS11252.1 hypothetical protein AsAng_0019640 [Aureispira anguillae]